MDRVGSFGGLLVLASLACAPLPELTPNTCGNGVIEALEACDTYPPPAYPDADCGSVAGPEHQRCKIVCSPPGPTGDSRCPLNWKCGADGVCRYPTGRFEPFGEPLELGEHDSFECSDVDGDSFEDLVVQGARSIDVHYSDGVNGFNEKVSFPVSGRKGQLSFSDLDRDLRTDIFAPTELGIQVIYGREGRQIETPIYPRPELLKQNSSEGRMLLVAVPKPCLGSRRLWLEQRGARLAARFIGEDWSHAGPELHVDDVFVGPDGPGFKDYALSMTDIDGDGGQELALGFVGDDSIYLLRPRLAGAQMGCGLQQLQMELIGKLSLPAGQKVGRQIALTHLDGDAQIDLLVFTDNSSQAAWVSLGQADGSFGPMVADHRFFRAEQAPACPYPLSGLEIKDTPLAVADFNEDGKADFVFPFGVLLADEVRQQGDSIQGGLCFIYPQQTAPFLRAVVGDFDADGHLDVLASATQKSGLKYLHGSAEGIFNDSFVELDSSPEAMVVGDFDGDGAEDLAFSTALSSGSLQKHQLSVLYGARDQRLGEPVEVGKVARLIGMVAGNDLGFGIPDLRSDLIVQSRLDDERDTFESFFLIFGRGERQQIAPLRLGPSIYGVVYEQAFGERSPELVAVAEEGFLSVPYGEDGAPRLARLGPLAAAECEELVKRPSCTVLKANSSQQENRGTIDALAMSFCEGEQPGLCRLTGFRDSAHSCFKALSLDERPFLPQGDLDQVLYRDIDGDNTPDLVVLFNTPEGKLIYLRRFSPNNSAEPYPSCGYFDAQSITLPAVEGVLRYVLPIQLNLEAGTEYALLTEDRLYVWYGAASKPAESRLRIDLPNVGRNYRMKAVDLNRDGLEDLVVGNGQQVQIYLAEPGTVPGVAQ